MKGRTSNFLHPDSAQQSEKPKILGRKATFGKHLHAQIAPDVVAQEIENFARSHVTISRLKDTNVARLTFDGAAPAVQPAISGEQRQVTLWNLMVELINTADNWKDTDKYCMKIDSVAALQGQPKGENVSCTVTLIKNQTGTYTIEFTSFAGAKQTMKVPEPEPIALTVKMRDDQMVVQFDHDEIDTRDTMILRPFQTVAMMQLANSFRKGDEQALCLMGPGSGKSLIMASLRACLRHTLGQFGSIVCILPNDQLATQFMDGDLRRSDIRRADDGTVYISSQMTVSEWELVACGKPGNLLILDREDEDYTVKRDLALMKPVMVMVDEAHQINPAEWEYIQRRSIYLMALTGSQTTEVMQSFADKVIFQFTTADAIRLKMARGAKIEVMEPHQRDFFASYLRYVSMLTVRPEADGPVYALNQKCYLFCQDRRSEAIKIRDMLIRLATATKEDKNSEKLHFQFQLQMSFLQANKDAFDKISKKLQRVYSPGSALTKTQSWRTNNGAPLIPKTFANDVQTAQQSQLAATINGIAHALLFGGNFENYQEAIITKVFSKDLAAKQGELKIFHAWQDETQQEKKDALKLANGCINTFETALLVTEAQVKEKIAKLLGMSALPEAQKQALINSCLRAVARLQDAIRERKLLSEAMVRKDEIDLQAHHVQYAEVIFPDSDEARKQEVLALFRYGFVMQLISQALKTEDLTFSTGTSVPSALGVIVYDSPHSTKDPVTAHQLWARASRSSHGKSFLVAPAFRECDEVNMADFVPTEEEVMQKTQETHGRLEKRHETKQQVMATRKKFSNHEMSDDLPKAERKPRCKKVMEIAKVFDAREEKATESAPSAPPVPPAINIIDSDAPPAEQPAQPPVKKPQVSTQIAEKLKFFAPKFEGGAGGRGGLPTLRKK